MILVSDWLLLPSVSVSIATSDAAGRLVLLLLTTTRQPPCATRMPPGPVLDEEDEQYASSQDSDFAPDEAPEPVSDQSDAEDAEEGEKKRKQSQPDGQAHDNGYDNSGDEAIIAKGKKRRKRAEEKGRPVDEDEGGEGGLVKTRAQRAAECVPSQPLPLMRLTAS